MTEKTWYVGLVPALRAHKKGKERGCMHLPRNWQISGDSVPVLPITRG